MEAKDIEQPDEKPETQTEIANAVGSLAVELVLPNQVGAADAWAFGWSNI